MAKMVTADLLSASSLIATCIGVLYTTWYLEFSKALELDNILTSTEKKRHRKLLKRLLFVRAIPLAFATALFAAALAAPAWQVVSGVSPGKPYDPVLACFGVVSVVVLIITASIIWLCVRLVNSWRKLG
ncbi:hypothetical protein [Actinoplanes sp. NPDC051859]|uniref:hypothetical protein n=1 Tax=Actinoplanes sp. NPDC051859 TaxID=3363909 RepID=UPI0037B94A06